MLLVVPLLLKVCSMAALEDRTLWVLKNSMGKLNRTIAINNFSLDIVSKKTNNFYDQTINFKI